MATVSELIDQSDLRVIMLFYKLDYIEAGGQLYAYCPFCAYYGEATFRADPTTKEFSCEHCKASGNTLTLVAFMEECSIEDAIDLLKTINRNTPRILVSRP